MMKTYKDLREYRALKSYLFSLVILFFCFFMIGAIANLSNIFFNISIVIVCAIAIFYFSYVLTKL